MYSFLILAIPSCIAIYCSLRRDYGITAFIPPVLFGAFTGVVTAFVSEFFILSDYDVPAELLPYFLHLSLETVIPILAFTLFWFLISKSGLRYNEITLFPLIASFYAVFTPYEAITSAERRAFFLLFINPLVLLGSVFIFCSLIRLLTQSFGSKKYIKGILFLLLSPVFLFTEPLIRSLWYYRMSALLYYGLSVIVILLSFIMYRAAFSQKTLDKTE